MKGVKRGVVELTENDLMAITDQPFFTIFSHHPAVSSQFIELMLKHKVERAR